jgi:hypothetical protein
MKQTMTIDIARAAATDAGRREMTKRGLPPAPWDRQARDAAIAEFNRLCREFNLLNVFVMPK